MKNPQNRQENNESIPLQYIKGIGPKRADALANEGILTLNDLMFYFPRAYVDRNAVSSLRALSIKLRQEESLINDSFKKRFSLYEEITVIAKISNKKENTFGKNRKMLVLGLNDGSGGVAQIIFWQFTDYYKKIFDVGQLVAVSGRVELDKFGKINFHHPEIEKIEEEDEERYQEGVILPVYRITEKMKNSGLSSQQFRKIFENLLPSEIPFLTESLPQNMLEKLDLLNIKDSILTLHFPQNRSDINKAMKRMKFEEILIFELFLAARHKGTKILDSAPVFNPKSGLARALYDSLPFNLTSDQKKVIREITDDFTSGKPMNRLLQGDVGSGKTIVALLCILIAIDNGYQCGFLAPTEILAEQHFNTINNFLKGEKFVSIAGKKINVVQLLGGQRVKVRREILEQIQTGAANIIIGTHALFETEIQYSNLGFIIIDEQHRFGVAQRAELINLAKKSLNENQLSPHILVMSATPIPRTLSMTVYGDLDVSVIKQMPLGRKPIKTKVMFESELPKVFDFIRKKVNEGQQAYIVYPLVEKSEKLEYKAATELYDKLQSDVFPEFKLGLLHGQMFWYEKDDTMKAFLNKEFHILVATTVIEVGIDVPNATVMLIENAERFGLSQLHQLRGRVGRSDIQSYCILATKDNFRYELSKKGVQDEDRKAVIIRLKTMEETTDGFEISEVDLKLRGPGDVLGTRQSGLPAFKYIDLVSDGDIITEARKVAFQLIEDDPRLSMKEHQLLKKKLVKLFKEGAMYFDVA